MIKRNHLTCLLAIMAMPLFAHGTARADHPLEGTWKVSVLSGGSELSVWLIQISDKDGKPSAKLLSTGLPGFDQVKFDAVKLTDKGIQMNLFLHGFPLYLTAYKGKDGTSETLLGSVILPDGGEPARLERTKADKIDPKEAKKDGKGSEEWNTANKAEMIKERIEIFKHIIKKFPDAPVALHSAMNLMDYTSDKATADDLKKIADQALTNAAQYGPELKMATARMAAMILLKSEKTKDLAVEYAEQAKKAMTKELPASDREFTLRTLIAALKQAGKEDAIKKLQDEVAQLGPELDAEFKKTAVPFTPEPFKGRKEKSKRVAVVELFTGAQCPPCVAADAAFDGLLQTFKPADVVFLQYHLHIPGPDPLTNKDSELREKFYNIEFTPTLLINGKKGPDVGGKKPHAKIRYDDVFKAISEQLEEAAAAEVELKADRDGDTINLTANVTKLKPGKKMKLRFALLEDVVHYPGANKQRYHHQVVRGFVGGAEGIDATMGMHKQSLDLKKLKLGLIEYLTEAHKKDPFLDDLRPLELQQLKVVALIQNDETKEILNAVQVNVPAQ